MSAQPKDTITYRVLPEEEWWKVEEVFRINGAELPDPNLACILAAEEGGDVSFFVLQYILHAEPMYVAPRHRGTRVWLWLASMMKDIVKDRRCYVIPESAQVEKMLVAAGLRKLPYPVYIHGKPREKGEF